MFEAWDRIGEVVGNRNHAGGRSESAAGIGVCDRNELDEILADGDDDLLAGERLSYRAS